MKIKTIKKYKKYQGCTQVNSLETATLRVLPVSSYSLETATLRVLPVSSYSLETATLRVLPVSSYSLASGFFDIPKYTRNLVDEMFRAEKEYFCNCSYQFRHEYEGYRIHVRHVRLSGGQKPRQCTSKHLSEDTSKTKINTIMVY